MIVTTLPPEAMENDGRWWKPARGATSTFQEFLEAETLFIAIHRDALWNPWVIEDRSDDLDRAMDVMRQWRRAEPNHRYLTKRQLDAHFAASDRRARARSAADERRHERDRERYDPDREVARLSLLEHRSRLDFDRTEVAALRSRERFPGMDDARRDTQIVSLDRSIRDHKDEIERLGIIVGDPETVVDKRGWTPADRRSISLTMLSARRSVRVRELWAKIPELTVALKTIDDRAERAKHRNTLHAAQRELDGLLAIPPLTADEMCSECATPYAKHGWSTPPSDGPCHAWPQWAKRLAQAREMIYSSERSTQVAEPKPARPEPLAVIPSALPIADILTRLQHLQQEHPDAEVRRGRANRWELWPKPSPTATDG